MVIKMKNKRKTNSGFDELAEFLLDPFNWAIAVGYVVLFLLGLAFFQTFVI